MKGFKNWSGNHVTLEELTQIEANARQSKSAEAQVILRLAAALREAMQVSAGAFSVLTKTQDESHDIDKEQDHYQG